MSHPGPRMKFQELDDIKLIKIVEQMGKPDWKKISLLLKKWTPRQCRDRYNNYLSPNVQNKKWTKEEDQILLDKYSIYGPKWSFLTRFFHNRAAVNIKNHYTKLTLKNTLKNGKTNSIQNNNNKTKDTNTDTNNKNCKDDALDFYKKLSFKPDLDDDDDSQYEIGHDYLDFPIGFFSNEIFNFII